jgi:hypothetical protein
MAAPAIVQAKSISSGPVMSSPSKCAIERAAHTPAPGGSAGPIAAQNGGSGGGGCGRDRPSVSCPHGPVRAAFAQVGWGRMVIAQKFEKWSMVETGRL